MIMKAELEHLSATVLNNVNAPMCKILQHVEVNKKQAKVGMRLDARKETVTVDN